MNMTGKWKQALIILTILSMALGSLPRDGFSAEAASVRMSYGGTAGYQLPLWVNKEMGLYKKYGIDLEIILIAAGSPNIQALLGGSLQVTPDGGLFGDAGGDARRAGGDRRHLGEQAPAATDRPP